MSNELLQNNLEQLRREKVELENTLEQEQEALVNRLWKRMDTLEVLELSFICYHLSIAIHSQSHGILPSKVWESYRI